jgi:hypothetical protein
MKNLILFFLFISHSLFAQITTEFSGNLEVQTRQAWNNKEAQEDLAQNWEEENFSLIYGNLSGKIELRKSRLDTNIFARYGRSDLYQDTGIPQVENFATRIFTFPQKLVARNLFKLENINQGSNYRSELILNKFNYEWDFEDNSFALGRLYINYGQGEIFNPINPFNQPTGLTAISQVAQGNDGMHFRFYVNEKYFLNFYFLGDKSSEGYAEPFDRTIWVHGEYQASNNLQLDYVLGEDQRRYKLGGQVSYNFSEAQIFGQVLYQTDYKTDRESHPLWDGLLGYDQQVTSKWHLRFEGGYQKRNRFINNLNAFDDRFLPSEYFMALANQIEVHPLSKLNATVINDIKTGFTYFILRNTFSLSTNTELDIFGYTPISKGSGVDNPAQKLITQDIGASLRAFF